MRRILLLICLLFIGYDINCQIDTLSDEFNRRCSLQKWKNINDEEGWNAPHVEELDIDITEEGKLRIMPYTTAWFANYRSNLLFKEVTGDFIYTIHVSATNRSGEDVPGGFYSLAGAMIRSRNHQPFINGTQNYVFLSLGHAASSHPSCPGDCPPPHFEGKTTTNSNSSLDVDDITVAEATIRMLRIDNAIVVLTRVAGENWEVRHRYNRTDMIGDTLQVGMVAYTNWQKVNTYSTGFHNTHTLNEDLDPDPSQGTPFTPDIIGLFEYARFDTLVIPSSMQGRNFFHDNNTSGVPTDTILQYYTYESTSDDIEGYKIWRGHDSQWDNPVNWSGNSLPTSSDNILIPNCSCPEAQYPLFTAGTYSFHNLIVEQGAQLTIGQDVIFTLTGELSNEGEIITEANGEIRME